MSTPTRIAAVLAACATLAFAQQGAPRRTVTAFGEATVSITPDLAKIDVGVVTVAATATDAASQNATHTTSVISQVQSVVGSTGTIKTISYSLNPNYNYPPNAQPVLTGYTATNVVEATTSNLSLVGKIIDAAIAGGANRVQSLQFTLQDDSAARAQALQAAAKRALSDAAAIAAGLGLHTGSVIQANEGTNVVTPVVVGGGAALTPTPIQPGNLDVRATVTVIVELTM